jgi:acyl-CoA dehydrogenase
MTDNELSQLVERVFADQLDPRKVCEAERGEWRGGNSLWASLEDLGLTLVDAPEQLGGSGGTLLDSADVLVATGRHAVPLPLAETAFVAGRALAGCGQPIPRGRLTLAGLDPLDRLVVAEGPAGRTLTGHARRVPWGGSADTLVVLAEDAQGHPFVGTVQYHEFKCEPGTNIAGEPRDDLGFSGPVLATCVPAPPGLRSDLLSWAALARCLQMLGALERVQNLTLRHASERVQFGKPIIKFQAVAHHIARLAADVALARASVELAVDATARASSIPVFEVATAKVICGFSARSVTAAAHQVHGAIGVTREHPLHVFTRRLWAWQDECGSENHWAEVLGRLVRDEASGAWPIISATEPRIAP